MKHGDRARAMVRVDVDIEEAFRVFTEEIDSWWRRGRKFRHMGARRGFIALEPRVGGRIYESFETSSGTKVIETGLIKVWDPPTRLVFDWRNATFRSDEATQVEVSFESTSRGTLVTVTHTGWSDIRADHPARHGDDVDIFIGKLARWWGDLLTGLRLHAIR